MNKRLQLVLPSKLVPAVLEGSHSSLVGGHMGAKKTLDKVRQLLFLLVGAEERYYPVVCYLSTLLLKKSTHPSTMCANAT